MTLSKQVSRQGLVIHRVILTWNHHHPIQARRLFQTPCWREPGVKPRTSLEFPASSRYTLRLTSLTQQHHGPLGR